MTEDVQGKEDGIARLLGREDTIRSISHRIGHAGSKGQELVIFIQERLRLQTTGVATYDKLRCQIFVKRHASKEEGFDPSRFIPSILADTIHCVQRA